MALETSIQLADDAESIRKAENKLYSETNDKGFLDLVRLSKGGGNYTRIGIVPLDLTFQEFSNKFEQVWSQALSLRNESPNKKLRPRLPVYLNRIFPSADGLKEIMQNTTSVVRPFEVIPQLIKEYTSNEDGIRLLSLLQKAPTGKIALQKVIQLIFDSQQSNLLRLAQDKITHIISKSDDVKKKFENSEIDKQLFNIYGVNHMSELGRAITEKISTNKEFSTEEEFKTNLLQAIGDTNDITKDEMGVIVEILFKRLRALGVMFAL